MVTLRRASVVLSRAVGVGALSPITGYGPRHGNGLAAVWLPNNAMKLTRGGLEGERRW